MAGGAMTVSRRVLYALIERVSRAAGRSSALEPAESRLAAVLSAATGHLILAYQPDGTIVQFNAGAELMLGYSAAEVVGKLTPMALLKPLALPESGAVSDRRAEPGVAAELGAFSGQTMRGGRDVADWTFLTKDGRPVVVSLTTSAMRDAHGEITGFVAIGTDVTEARAAAQVLSAQQKIYRLLVDHLPLTSVALFDDELRCVTIGGHWVQSRGAGAEAEARGKRIDGFVGARSAAKVLEYARSALDHPAEIELTGEDGRHYELSGLPVAGPHDERLLLSVMREVTAVRRADQQRQEMMSALRVSEASFRGAFEGAPIGMALVSVGEVRVDRFLQVNAAFAAILGRRPQDLIGLRVADVTHPEDVHVQPDLHTDETHPKFRKRFLRPSGREVWVEVSYAIVHDEQGKPSHVVKQIQDLSTIKESERALLDALEQQRAATASLRELDRIRTELVSNISHELRTPLTSIHGYLELLSEEPLDDSQLAMIEVAARNTENLRALVDDLLVLIRLDAVDSLGAFDTADVEIPAVVSTAIDTVRPAIIERNQTLDVRLPVQPAIVRGDSDQLDRVMVNLLSNASKYTPEGGRIELRVANSHGNAVVTVTDTGIGIAPEEQEQLFTRFFRASSARATAVNGSGLGLAIVKSIVERHGGTVSVVSEPGSGSQFTVALPLVVRVPGRAPDVVASR